MATIQDRPFATDYSGLVNQTVIAGVVFTFGVVVFEVFKRRRRGKKDKRKKDGLGSVETWEFGYLYNGRYWSRDPSPPSPSTWPIYSWVKQAIMMSEDEFFRLRGLDATLYCRIMRGCLYFSLIHMVTTLPILLPIHIIFSSTDVAHRSLLRASISSLSGTAGTRFFPLHVVLSYWIVITWTITLLWCAQGLFRYRAQSIQSQIIPSTDHEKLSEAANSPNRGLRWRTIMVTNIPGQLRSEKDLHEYFDYYLSRPLQPPITQTIVGKAASIYFRRAKKTAVQILPLAQPQRSSSKDFTPPQIEQITVVRKLTELATLLQRREDNIRKLELVHLKLAKRVLQDVKADVDKHSPLFRLPKSVTIPKQLQLDHTPKTTGLPIQSGDKDDTMSHKEELKRYLEPFLHVIDVPCPNPLSHIFYTIGTFLRSSRRHDKRKQIRKPDASLWGTLHDLPRHLLDPYQPLIRVKTLFRGSTIPAIDYYNTKVSYLTTLIEEHRSRSLKEFSPASTAFVTFKDPSDAFRVCKYLPSHPDNPVACLTGPAPDVMDLDWDRVMKSTFTGEFIRDWVVSVGVWVFTLLWIIPVTFFVSLVNISKIAVYFKPLADYLNSHAFAKNIISNFLPTILVSILAILVPLVLLLLAKKASVILTFSALHDRIMVRYHKFLVCNLLVFFCVGVAALESLLTLFKSAIDPVELIAQSYPTAGPFYVGWLIFTTGIHAGLEIGLLGLPLLVYPGTARTPLPRKRAAGIRPRTLNYYYWLPNHVFIMFLIFIFATLNPLVIPFTLTYFAVDSVVIRNQLIHVYAKPYEGQGRNILIRFTRYSMDGLILAEVVLFAFLLLNKKIPHAVLMVVLMAVTIGIKLYLTRLFHEKFHEADVLEAEIVCGIRHDDTVPEPDSAAIPQVKEGTYRKRIKDLQRLIGPTPDKPLPKPLDYIFRLGQRPFHHTDEPSDSSSSSEHRNGVHMRLLGKKAKPTQPRSQGLLNQTVVGREGRIAEGADFTGVAGPIAPAEPTVSALQAQKEGTIVTVHQFHPTWDDTPHYDIPYENPYYTRLVDNFLWLPNDPFGVLDLDDTVDVHRSITCEAGESIGAWLQQPPNRLHGVNGAADEKEHVRPRPTGRESIALPAGVASRIPSDRDIDYAEVARPASWKERRQSSASSTRRPTLGRRRSSRSGVSVRVDSAEEVPMVNGQDQSQLELGRAKSYGHLRAPAPPTPQRRSASWDNTVQQRDPLASSASQAPPRPPSQPLAKISEGEDQPPVTSTIISTQHAVADEVLAEEEIEAEQRQEREYEEEMRAQPSGKRGVFSWLWRGTTTF